MAHWLGTALAGVNAIDDRVFTLARVGVAFACALVLAWTRLAGARGRSPDARRGLGDSLLVVCGMLALLSWTNFGRFHRPGYLHLHDVFHYYIGSKYFPELGYTRLYACTAAADIQAGAGSDVQTRGIRNLLTNDLELGEAIAVDPAICDSYFTPERWEMFTQDVAWFRARLPADSWKMIQLDHGYNASPAWGILGRLLSNAAPASSSWIVALALIDPLLLLTMWAAIWWAFGWRVMCIALVWWGTNDLAGFNWNGGAFLREDWLLCTSLGICLMKRNRPAASGFALTYAATLRVFPAFVMGGLALKSGIRMWRTRSLSLPTAHRQFAKGGLVALALVVPLSLAIVGGGVRGGIDAWSGFVANSQKHLATPMTNNMGLKAILSYKPESRMAVLRDYWLDTPWDTWMIARRQAFADRKPLFAVLVAAFVVVLGFAVRDQEDWIALTLATALIVIAADPACYYLGVLLVFGFLWDRWPWMSLGLCVLSILSIAASVFLEHHDDHYVSVSLAGVLFVGAAVVYAATSDRQRVTGGSGLAPADNR